MGLDFVPKTPGLVLRDPVLRNALVAVLSRKTPGLLRVLCFRFEKLVEGGGLCRLGL